MIIVSIFLSIYLLIGILSMIFMVCVAKKYQLNITVETVVLGILVWFFSLPEIFRLIWSSWKLFWATEEVKRSLRNIKKEKKKLDRMLDNYEKEIL